MDFESIKRQAIASTANLCIVPGACHTAFSLSGWRTSNSNNIIAIAFARIFDPKVSVTCAKRGAFLNGHLIRGSILRSQRAPAATLSVTCSIIVITDRPDHGRRSWRSRVVKPWSVGEQTDERSVVKVLRCKSQHQSIIGLDSFERTPFPPQVSVSSELHA